MGPMDTPVHKPRMTWRTSRLGIVLLEGWESKLLILTTDIAATFTSPLEETHYGIAPRRRFGDGKHTVYRREQRLA